MNVVEIRSRDLVKTTAIRRQPFYPDGGEFNG